MEKETTRKVGAAVLSFVTLVMLVVSAAPTAQAVDDTASTSQAGSCITVDTTAPGVNVDPQSCTPVTEAEETLASVLP